jgi:hypothetical protein
MGAGSDFIVLGRALRTSEDHLPPASVLARSFTVYLVGRRGRGASGPQSPSTRWGRRWKISSPSRRETGAAGVRDARLHVTRHTAAARGPRRRHMALA